MPNLFRKIRKELLNIGKIKSYISYAIGEVILIVLGIIIAIQINNWNQRRIDRRSEIIFINSLVEDINQEIIRFERNLELGKIRMEAINFILQSNRTGFSSGMRSKLDTALSVCLSITKEKTIFLNEYVIQGRLDKINDDDLKNQIANYFQASDNLSRFENTMLGDFFRNDLLPFYYKHLNVNQGLKLLPKLTIWGKIRLWESQDIEVGNLYQVDSIDVNSLDNPNNNKQIINELMNLMSEYYFATEIANKAYPGMIKDARNLISKCNKYINK